MGDSQSAGNAGDKSSVGEISRTASGQKSTGLPDQVPPTSPGAGENHPLLDEDGNVLGLGDSTIDNNGHLDEKQEDDLFTSWVNEKPDDTAFRYTIRAKPNLIKLEENKPFHPEYQCNDNEISGIGGVRFRPKCAIHEMSIKTLFGPQDARAYPGDPPVNNMTMTAHTTSVLLDGTLPPEQKQRMLMGDKPYHTVEGWALAISLLKSKCVHFSKRYDEFGGNDMPTYEVKDNNPPLDIYQAAWIRSKSEPLKLGGVHRKEGKAVILAPSFSFKLAKKHFEFESEVVLYDKFSEVPAKLRLAEYNVAYIVAPTTMQSLRMEYELKLVDETLRKEKMNVI